MFFHKTPLHQVIPKDWLIALKIVFFIIINERFKNLHGEKKLKIRKIIGILATMVGITAGSIAIFEFFDNPSTDQTSPRPNPKILVFQAKPSMIKEGLTTQLIWSVQDASSIVIDQGIGDVPMNGSRTVSPKTTTIYTLSASRGSEKYRATTQVTVAKSTWEEKNSIGAFPGDEIYHFKVLSYAKDHLIVELSYRYSPQHGQAWIGGYILDDNGQSISRGFQPTGANPTGKTEIRVNVDPAKGRTRSKWVFFWIYESNKAKGFVSKRFPYEHIWN